jgi:hypothetical protein
LLARLPDWLTADPPDAHLFVGIGPIVLALVAVGAVIATWARRRASAAAAGGEAAPITGGGWRRHPVLFYAGLALVSFWFTLGPPLGLWQWTYWMPVFSFLRVPSRFVLLEVLALAILSGFGAQWLSRQVRPSRAGAVAVVAGLLLLLEFAPWGLPTSPFQIDVTSADRWLAGRPRPFVVAELPVPVTRDEVTRARRNTLFMQHSTAHWGKIVHGYSGVEPQHYTRLQDLLARFPDEESLNALVDLGVTYVVMHPYLYEYDETDLEEVDARFEK